MPDPTTPFPLELETVETHLKDLPATPQMLPEFHRLISDYNTNPDDILDLIKLEPALAARIVRASNAAFYSPGFPIQSVQDAITFLGFKELYRIVALFSMSSIMMEPLSSYGMTQGDFWKRSVLCALAMEGLCRSNRQPIHQGYTIGLLHGIGMVFVDKLVAQLPQSGSSRIRFAYPGTADDPCQEQEVNVLGLSHAEVGAYALWKWKFPEELVDPVRFQFDPLECRSVGKMTCLLNLAKWITNTICFRDRPDWDDAPDPLILQLLGLDEEVFYTMVAETSCRYEELEGLMTATG
ncbi:MAG: HDOD domain-containing protein [Puniceicoccaceae bacterium]|nr:MAG: HDOD domain-containing protein [Puniceicoccaceae bacterium]